MAILKFPLAEAQRRARKIIRYARDIPNTFSPAEVAMATGIHSGKYKDENGEEQEYYADKLERNTDFADPTWIQPKKREKEVRELFEWLQDADPEAAKIAT